MFLFLDQLIMVSASANKLSKLKENAGEYACLIMEELDPEDVGYIEVCSSGLQSVLKIATLICAFSFSYGSWKHFFYKGTIT